MLERFIKNETNENSKETGQLDDDQSVLETMEFVQRNTPLFTNYACGRVQFLPAPKGLNTFAFDLQKNCIYISDRFYRQKGMSEEKTSFGVLHEIEHFLEKAEMLREEKGIEKFDKYLTKLDDPAYGLMDNLMADIRENRTVVSRRHQGFRDAEVSAYKEDLFKDVDYTSEPKHIQFLYGLFRENRVPDEEVIIDGDVREEINKILGIKNKKSQRLLDLMTDPKVPMSIRLELQDKFIWPVVDALRNKDIDEQKKKEEKENSESENEGENKEVAEGEQKEGQPSDKKGKPKKGKEGMAPQDPKEIFKDTYERSKDRVLPSVPVEKMKEEFERYKKIIEEEKNKIDPDQDFADRLGVSKQELQNYRNTVEKLEKNINPETQKSAIEELRELIRSILSRRKKTRITPKYPLEEGDTLVEPGELIAEVKRGNLQPHVWQEEEMKEFKGEKCGEVEVTIIGDRSRSMKGNKVREQGIATVLFLEMFKEFADMADEERSSLRYPLEVRSEVYSFQSSEEDKKPLKEMSKELGETERIKIASKMGQHADASTTDYVSLTAIDNKLDLDKISLKKIKNKEMRKLVIVFTDGDSDNPVAVQNVLKSLRDKGVIVVGIGITKSGESALVTYAPQAVVAEKTEDIPVVLKNILKEHLLDI